MSKTSRLEIVQVARAIAILFVLVGHTNITFMKVYRYDWFNIGSWEKTGGVDFFFIVTGFMIYYLYHRHIGNSRKAKQFLLKRILRLIPLYWLFTTAVIVATQLILDMQYDFQTIIKTLLLIPGDPVIDSAWSLTYIFLFYILFFFYLITPNLMRLVISSIVVLILLVEVRLLPFLPSSYFSIYLVEILGGSFVAFISGKVNDERGWLWVLFGLGGYILGWIDNIYGLMPFEPTVTFGLSAMILMYGISQKDKVDRKIPILLSFLGDASYSIYIAHGPFLQLYILLLLKWGILELTSPGTWMVSLMILVTFSCCMTYLLIEKPMTKFLRRKLISDSGPSSIPMPVPMAEQSTFK
ncbi:UNVERIFIED_CONTAM: acyltransferase [Halobacillus marinus]